MKRIQCTNCCHGYFVAMRKKSFEQYGMTWYEHKCTACPARINLAIKYI